MTLRSKNGMKSGGTINPSVGLDKATRQHYQRALLIWHIDLQALSPRKYRDSVQFRDPEQFAERVIGKDGDPWKGGSIAAGVLNILLKEVGGYALWADGYSVYPGDLLNWPVDWPMLDNSRAQVTGLITWVDFCREGLEL